MIELVRGDPLYPVKLLDLPRPPEPLWCAGDASLLQREAIAIVGTRRMTSYGERIARELGLACARAGVVVVSGLATGIDSTAHAAALDGGHTTVAVLGEGLSAFNAYGRRRRLAARIRAEGCIVSEYQPLFPGDGWTFAKRNATIAALARAVVVVEAPHGSGALITAEDARRLGRELLAVPGPLGAPASEGTNALIACGLARAVTGPESLGLAAARAVPSGHTRHASDDLLARLAAGPLSPDALAGEEEHLAELVLCGRVVALPDGRFART